MGISIGQAIKKSFINETANALILLLLIWGGVAVADIYFNQLLGIGLIAFIALIPCIVAGFIYIRAMLAKSKMSPNGIAYFNINGQNYYIKSGVTSVKNPGGAALILIAIKSLIALPVYLFKIVLRIFQSICSETYRNNINEYYDTHEKEIKNKLKKGGVLSISYVLTITFLFGLYGMQCAIYSPKKVKFENVELQYYSNALGEGYYFSFDYYSSSDRVVEMHTGNSNDDVVL